jgi:L-amino acid N-acyltransferase YncA
MSFLIRDYQKSDTTSILDIINDSILNTFHNYDYKPKTLAEIENLFEEKIKVGYPILVGEINGQIVGYATFGRFRAKPGYDKTIEHSIYLTKNAQSKGLGTEMMRKLIQIATESDFHVMIAGMDSENTGSYQFHERLGFKEVARFSEVGFKFGKWLNLVFMQLILKSKN